MARYFIKIPAYVNNQYIDASPQNPRIVEFDDDTAPSFSWEPVDKAAQAALLKLGVKKELLSPVDVAQRKQDVDDTATMSDLRKAAQGKTVGG